MYCQVPVGKFRNVEWGGGCSGIYMVSLGEVESKDSRLHFEGGARLATRKS